MRALVSFKLQRKLCRTQVLGILQIVQGDLPVAYPVDRRDTGKSMRTIGKFR